MIKIFNRNLIKVNDVLYFILNISKWRMKFRILNKKFIKIGDFLKYCVELKGKYDVKNVRRCRKIQCQDLAEITVSLPDHLDECLAKLNNR